MHADGGWDIETEEHEVANDYFRFRRHVSAKGEVLTVIDPEGGQVSDLIAVADGDPGGAARSAAMVAMFLMIDTGLMAPVRGWLRRAEKLLSTAPNDSIRATVSAVRTYERFMCGDLDAASREAGRAIDLGRTSGNAAASVIGRTATARISILYGQVAEGIAELDDVGVLLMGGAVDPLTTGMMLCEIVCAAQGLSLHEMAVEWTRAMASCQSSTRCT